MITFIDILQGNDAVVLVDCTIEGEPDITCVREGNDTNVTESVNVYQRTFFFSIMKFMLQKRTMAT